MALDSTSNKAVWGPSPEILHLISHEEFKAVQQVIHNAITKVAVLHPYNTLNTFVSFHRAYREQKELTLEQFVKISDVKHEEGNLSCVGLSYKVIEYVKEADPALGRYLYLAICSDFDPDTPNPKDPPSTETAFLFEHLLTVLAFSFKGRRGYMLADNSHVYFPVVIMTDSQSPHTGIFHTLSRHGQRESHMQMVSDSYAIWNQTESKPEGVEFAKKRFIYLEKPYLLADDADRRAKVIPFHGHIILGTDGFKAILYTLFGKHSQRFTLTVPDKSGKFTSVHLPHDYFLAENHSQDDLEVNEALEVFANMCGFAGRDELIERYRALSETCMDTAFIEELVALHDRFVAKLNSEYRAAGTS